MKIFFTRKDFVPRLPTRAQPLDPAGDSNLQLQLLSLQECPSQDKFLAKPMQANLCEIMI